MRRSIRPAVPAALSALAALTLLTACGSGVQFVRQDMTQYPSKPDDAQIEVLDSGTMKPYVVIGTLTVDRQMKASFNDRSTYDDAIAMMVAHARKVGADAIINLKPVDDPSGLEARVVLTGTAVRYMEQAERVSSDPS
jgi:hypothetical protein